MAITQNTYTGDGSTVLFSFTFPYLETTDIKVSLDGTDTNEYTLANATTIQFNTAPANAVAIRIYRQTDDSALAAQFYPGSAIRSQDLNDNFTQNLYVTQESNREATTASTLADTATTTANTALSTATAASTNAATALSTANTALSNSTSAVSTANSASSSATTALNAANAAVSAVANVVLYEPVANVAAIPGSPADADAVEVVDSTGIESFSPLSGLPAGFIGDSGLSVRILYSTSGSTWSWIQYYPNDPEDRYGDAITQAQSDITQAQSDILGLDTIKLDSTTAAATYAPLANPTFTGTVTIPAGASISGYLESSSIGSTVQAYDADTAKTDVAQTFTAQQTFGELKETVYTLGTTGSIALDPANGSIQSSVLTGAPTFTDSLEAGQTIVLMLEGGATYSVTWPTITWVTSAGNAAPTLTAKDTLVLWKVSTTLYGAYVGSYV